MAPLFEPTKSERKPLEDIHSADERVKQATDLINEIIGIYKDRNPEYNKFSPEAATGRTPILATGTIEKVSPSGERLQQEVGEKPIPFILRRLEPDESKSIPKELLENLPEGAVLARMYVVQNASVRTATAICTFDGASGVYRPTSLIQAISVPKYESYPDGTKLEEMDDLPLPGVQDLSWIERQSGGETLPNELLHRENFWKVNPDLNRLTIVGFPYKIYTSGEKTNVVVKKPSRVERFFRKNEKTLIYYKTQLSPEDQVGFTDKADLLGGGSISPNIAIDFEVDAYGTDPFQTNTTHPETLNNNEAYNLSVDRGRFANTLGQVFQKIQDQCRS